MAVRLMALDCAHTKHSIAAVATFVADVVAASAAAVAAGNFWCCVANLLYKFELITINNVYSTQCRVVNIQSDD
jgi:hypothetical protein